MCRLVFQIVFIISFFYSGLASAQTIASSDKQATFIELYTSEGCSSCPPADKWLANFKNHPDLWNNIVPIAFHVDYWDWIGWKDEFAQPAFGDRHKRYKKYRKTRSVYTPGFFINGSEWRGFFDSQPLPKQRKSVGKIVAAIKTDSIEVSFSPKPPLLNVPLQANIAFLDFNESNRILFGENIGKKLEHEFIAQQIKTKPLRLNDEDKVYRATFKNLPKLNEQIAIVIWVNDEQTLDVIQATGSWMGNKDKGARAP